jgi:hypothetical protein
MLFRKKLNYILLLKLTRKLEAWFIAIIAITINQAFSSMWQACNEKSTSFYGGLDWRKIGVVDNQSLFI